MTIGCRFVGRARGKGKPKCGILCQETISPWLLLFGTWALLLWLCLVEIMIESSLLSMVPHALKV